MSEDATWKAVSTLEWRKKQKAPAEPKGFGAILGEAADAVADKWNSTGNLVPTYLKRMTEIQLQDESYIHQQLVKPEEAKPKRGLNRLISGGKGKAGRGIRLLKPIGSRKVRFGDDPHCKAAAGCLKAGGGGTNSTSSSSPFAATSSPASRGSSYNKRATAGAGGLKYCSRLHVAEGAAASSDDTITTAVQASGSASATVATQATAIAAGSPAASAQTVTPGSNTSSAVRKGSSRPQSPAAPVQQQLLFCHVPSKQPSTNGQLPRQPSSTSATAPAPSGNFNTSSSSSSDGTVNMMSVLLQQQAMQQAPETPSFTAGSLGGGNWAGNCSGHWEEAPSKTELVDKQLQRLRISMAPQVLQEPQQQQQGLASPLGYRPLAIPEELFQRWSTVAGGGTSSASALAARRTSTDAPAGTGSAGSRASRRGSNSNIPNSYGEAAQAGTPQRACSNSKDSSRNLQRSGSSRDVEAMAVASGNSGSGAGISTQHSSRSVGDGAISSRQRRTSDYMTALGSIEASLHPRQTGMSGSCSTTPGSISPQQHPSSPRGGRHSSSGIIATRSGSGGSTAGRQQSGSVARPQRSNSSTLPDVGKLQLQCAPSPSKPLGASGRGSRPSSNPRGNRASIDLHSIPGPGAVVPANSARATQGRIGSPPTSGGSSSNGNSSSGETQTQQRLSGATAAGDIADTGRKNGGCIAHLPEIGRHAAKQPQKQLAGIGRRR